MAVSARSRATGEGKLTSFERFERLARNLFAVPKKELDEKLAGYKKQKRKRRKAS